MTGEWKRNTTVLDGGRVELVVPDLRRGESVEVIVRRPPSNTENGHRPGFGAARGQMVMRHDFDAPLDEFGDYA